MQTNFGEEGLEEEVPETRTGEDCLVDNRSESGIERAHEPRKPDGSSSFFYLQTVGGMIGEGENFELAVGRAPNS